MTTDRRTFLRYLTSATLTASLPNSINRALAIPAHYRTGTIDDVEHVVFLMQENRAFDHYFGTLRGVRGYGDPRPAFLPSGKPVFFQPDGDSFLLPFHPTVDNFGLAFLEDTPHGWSDTHAAWNGGKYDQWIHNKGRSTMAFYMREDIPFIYALADAFTICDAYHCSFLGATDPNRYYMWTGWVSASSSRIRAARARASRCAPAIPSLSRGATRWRRESRFPTSGTQRAPIRAATIYPCSGRTDFCGASEAACLKARPTSTSMRATIPNIWRSSCASPTARPLRAG
jgi:hypothetical protein